MAANFSIHRCYKNMRTDKSVLVLDASWRVAGTTTPKMAFVDMAKRTVVALRFHDLTSFEPVFWDEWVVIPVENGQEHVVTPSQKILMPKVIIAVNYKRAKVVYRLPRVRSKEVMKVYGGRCAYTGKHVGKNGSVDHVVPRSRNGSNTWDNVVWADSKVNAAKGDKTLSEAGLKLKIFKKVRPVLAGLDVEPLPDREEWLCFLMSKS